MRKLFILTLKEIKLTFRDVGSVILMIVIPLILTFAVVAAFGQSGSGAVSQLPVLLLNEDNGPVGQQLVDVFQSDEVKEIIALQLVTDAAAARAAVDSDQAVAAVMIPADFSLRLAQPSANPDAGPALVDIYGNPVRPIGVSIVNSIAARFLGQANITAQGAQSLTRDMVDKGIVSSADPQDLASLQESLLTRLAQSAGPGVQIDMVSSAGRAFNWLDYFAPSMAILFLMFYTLTAGRTLLDERQTGTLPRLLVSPTSPPVILLGKMSGIFITGLLQMVVLLGITSFIGAYWGELLPAFLSIVLVVLCATGLGAMIAAWSRSPVQANALGISFVLTASALSGNFLPRMNLPAWMQSISLITPNAWGLELFMRLQAGAGLQDILPMLGGVLVLGAVYYALATVGFRRQFA